MIFVGTPYRRKVHVRSIVRRLLQGWKKMQINGRTAAALSILLWPVSIVHGQLYIEGDPIIINQSSRAEAMGLSYVSQREEVGGMYWNPASLRAYASVYGNGFMRLGERHGLAIGFVHTAYGSDWASPNLVFQSVNIGYSFRLTKVLSLGVLTFLNKADTFSNSVYSMFAIVGLSYMPNSGIRYGIAYEGFGNGIDYSRFALSTKRGISRVLRVGASYGYPTFRQYKWVTLTISGEKHFGMRGYHAYLGFEVTPLRFLDLRIGYVDKPSESTYYRSGARYGIGFRFEPVYVDYVLSPSVSALRHHQMTLRVLFPGILWNPSQ
jgi:hypothetical protein